VVVPTQLGIEPGREVPFRQMDMVLTPRREVGQGGPVPRGGGAPFDNGLAPAAHSPAELKAEELKGTPVSSIRTAEQKQAGFVRRQRQAVLGEPLSQHVIETLSIRLVLERGPIVIGVATQLGRTPTVDLHRLLKPEVEDIVEIDISQDQRDCAPLRSTHHRLPHLPVRLQDTSLQPLAYQPQKRLVVDPFRSHRQESSRVDVLEEALDVRFHPIVVESLFEGAGQLPNSVQRPNTGAVAA
jgi:hypothetical protein